MTFREQLRAIIAAALERNYPDAGSLRFDVSKPREKSFGDFATNVAMVASKPLALKPMEIAEKLAKDLESSDLIESVDVALPGFINFVISRHAYLEKLREIITAEDDEHYGYVNLGEGKKIQVEFVSANPTGPLNIVNARAAAVGDALVRLFKRVGYEAYSEFYVNDTGTQVELLGQSLRARFAQLIGRQAEIPEGGYPGEYLVEIARRVLNLAEQAQRLDESLKRALSGKHPLGEAIGDLTKRGKCPQDVAERFVTFVQHLEPNLGSNAVSLYVCYQSRNSRSGDEIQADLAGLESLVEGGTQEALEGGETAANIFLGEVHESWSFDFARFAVEEIVKQQRESLERYGNRPDGGLRFDCWFRESSLKNDVEELGKRLVADGRFVVEKEGAVWLRGGDESDEWVIRRSSGQPTYFLSDIAYHINKRRRGFAKVIDIWGPDHHGHIKRMQTAMNIVSQVFPDLEINSDWLTVLIAQQVNLLRDGRRIQMSKRAGEYVTLDDLVREVGADVARFFFLMRRCNSHLDFDLDLAKKTSDENPVYYVQYAHARISSIIEFARSQGYESVPPEDVDLELLAAEEEIDLLKALADFDDLVIGSALSLEPHRFTSYLIDLASRFHRFYHNHRVVTEDAERTKARLCLCLGVRTVIRSVFSILGISAPDSM